MRLVSPQWLFLLPGVGVRTPQLLETEPLCDKQGAELEGMRGSIKYFPSPACWEGLLPFHSPGCLHPCAAVPAPTDLGGFGVPPKLIVGRFGLPKSSEFSAVIIISFRGSPQLSWSKPG